MIQNAGFGHMEKKKKKELSGLELSTRTPLWLLHGGFLEWELLVEFGKRKMYCEYIEC